MKSNIIANNKFIIGILVMATVIGTSYGITKAHTTSQSSTILSTAGGSMGKVIGDSIGKAAINVAKVAIDSTAKHK